MDVVEDKIDLNNFWRYAENCPAIVKLFVFIYKYIFHYIVQTYVSLKCFEKLKIKLCCLMFVLHSNFTFI